MTEADSIMMIEDDDGHARLIEKNIRRSGLTNPIFGLRMAPPPAATCSNRAAETAPHNLR